jgi:hypothetical protein
MHTEHFLTISRLNVPKLKNEVYLHRLIAATLKPPLPSTYFKHLKTAVLF